MNIGGFLRRNAVAIVLVTSFSGCGGAIFYPALSSARSSAQRSNCQSQLKRIGLACIQYQQDNDGKYPPLSSEDSRGWALLIQKYALNIPLKPSCPAGYKSSFSPSSDYFFNAQLATRPQSFVQDPALTIAFGDGPDNGPTNSHYWELPNDGDNESSPLNRHLELANYVFTDGHVKLIAPRRFTEWHFNTDDANEWHYKMAPTRSAFRPKHRGHSSLTKRQNGLHKLNHAVHPKEAN